MQPKSPVGVAVQLMPAGHAPPHGPLKVRHGDDPAGMQPHVKSRLSSTWIVEQT